MLVAFSGGKDAIATNLALREDGIETVLAHLYLVPGPETAQPLNFVKESLDQMEDAFGQRIYRYPHPSLPRWLNGFVFQPWDRVETITAANLWEYSYADIWKHVKNNLGLEPDTWIADGVRAADSIVRRASLSKHGCMKPSSGKVSPIADWLKREVMDAIDASNVELPIDYELFGRSFDGLDYRFLKPIHDNLPDDWAQILEWFPYAEMELLRHEL